MKFLFISRAFGFYTGGTENYEVGLAKSLQSFNHEVHFLIGAPILKREGGHSLLSDFNVFLCRSLFLKDFSQRLYYFSDKVGRWLFYLDNYIFQKACLRRLKKLLKKQKYDVIQVSGQIDLIPKIKELTKSRVILFFPGMPDVNKLDKIKLADRLFTDGYAYKFLKEIYPKTALINGGVRQEIRFSQGERLKCRSKFINSNEEMFILMVNRLVYLKNVSLGVDIVNDLLKKGLKCKLIIAGDGPDKIRIKDKILDNNLEKNVFLVGEINPSKIYKYYSAADIFLMTSIAENFPNVIKEAMTVGLPIFCSDSTGMSMQIESGRNGFTCKSKEDFVENILLLIKDKDMAATISACNRIEASEKFNWKINTNNYLNYIN